MHLASKSILYASEHSKKNIIISTIIKLVMHYLEHASKHIQTFSHKTKRYKYEMLSLTVEELLYITISITKISEKSILYHKSNVQCFNIKYIEIKREIYNNIKALLIILQCIPLQSERDRATI